VPGTAPKFKKKSFLYDILYTAQVTSKSENYELSGFKILPGQIAAYSISAIPYAKQWEISILRSGIHEMAELYQR
jgi:hypothetical protein